MEDILEGRVKEKGREGIVSLIPGEVKAEKNETTYRGLQLVEDKEYAGGTSIKYWM
ncbi:hypothetical protein HZA98_00520 [Candidatus Woesearchaeota archaeon]|nr:hypothetical protein [Candidatus Woesearchaeota archaeon]